LRLVVHIVEELDFPIKSMTMKHCLTLSLLFVFGTVFAQLPDDEYFFGFKAGATYSTIDEIKTTLIRPVHPEATYNTSIVPRYGAAAGLFFYYKFRGGSFLAIQPEIVFAMQGGDFKYDDVNGLEYMIQFRYEYLNITPQFKIYPLAEFGEGVSGFHIGIAPQIGVNLASTNIIYNSNTEVIGQDLQIQQNLREVLKGKTDVSIALSAGIEIGRLFLEARWNVGLQDVIETQANGYYFIENRNRSNSYQFTVGYAIPFDQ